MKKVILIDTENMGKGSYQGLEGLTSEFEVVFFESEHSVNIPETILLFLNKKDIEYSFEWCERNRLSKDTMDFCMVAYLALRSRLAGDKETYYLLSKDSDFEVPSAYIAGKLGITVYLAKEIEGILENNNLDKKQLTPEQIINLCVEQARSKQQFHCLLQKTLKCFYHASVISNIYWDNVDRLKIRA